MRALLLVLLLLPALQPLAAAEPHEGRALVGYMEVRPAGLRSFFLGARCVDPSCTGDEALGQGRPNPSGDVPEGAEGGPLSFDASMLVAFDGTPLCDAADECYPAMVCFGGEDAQGEHVGQCFRAEPTYVGTVPVGAHEWQVWLPAGVAGEYRLTFG